MGVIGEAIIHVSGLENVLSGKKKTVTDAEKERIARMPGQVYKAMMSWFKGTKTKPPKVQTQDWKKVRSVIENWTIENNMELIESLPSNAGMDLSETVSVVHSVLFDALPRRSIEGVSGTIEIEPAKGQIADFLFLWEIADEPGLLIQLLTSGSLSRYESKFFRGVYPGLFSEYQYQITRAIVDYGKEPDWNVQKGLSIMFGTPLAGLEDVKALQKGLGGSSSSPSKGGGTSPLDVKVDDMLTTAQRAEFS